MSNKEIVFDENMQINTIDNTKGNSDNYKLYKKIIKKPRKQLIAVAKHFQPYDYAFIVELIEYGLKEMLAYYQNGANVHGLDYANHVREDICIEALNKINAWKEDFENEQAHLTELFNYLGENIMWLWD